MPVKGIKSENTGYETQTLLEILKELELSLNLVRTLSDEEKKMFKSLILKVLKNYF